MSKFQKILGLVLADHSLGQEHVPPLDSEALKALELQADRIPEEELENFIGGEYATILNIAEKYNAQGLSDFLDSLV